jgi:ribosomal protein S14
MYNSIQRDLKRRKLFYKNEIKRLELKSLINDLNISKEMRYNFITQLNKLPRNSSRVRIKNRCILTGRGRSVYKFCRLSRIKLRELAAQGLLMGVQKSSW